MRCKACYRMLSRYAIEDYCSACVIASEDNLPDNEYSHSAITENVFDLDINPPNRETGHGYYFDFYQYTVASKN